jgi:hypothetical protein
MQNVNITKAQLLEVLREDDYCCVKVHFRRNEETQKEYILPQYKSIVDKIELINFGNPAFENIEITLGKKSIHKYSCELTLTGDIRVRFRKKLRFHNDQWIPDLSYPYPIRLKLDGYFTEICVEFQDKTYIELSDFSVTIVEDDLSTFKNEQDSFLDREFSMIGLGVM